MVCYTHVTLNLFNQLHFYLFLQGFQLGTTELSRYWIYWVPAQYVEAIKDLILGKWMYF